jgi:hypothetical protein
VGGKLLALLAVQLVAHIVHPLLKAFTDKVVFECADTREDVELI